MRELARSIARERMKRAGYTHLNKKRGKGLFKNIARRRAFV